MEEGRQWSFDADATKEALARFFGKNHQKLSSYGSTVNQVFEAFVFSKIVERYRSEGWGVALQHPGGRAESPVRLSLITFGEAKHMSAYAELVASFLGLVHEMQPHRLTAKSKGVASPDHVSPFLYVSGSLYYTGRGVKDSIARRELDSVVADLRGVGGRSAFEVTRVRLWNCSSASAARVHRR